ncbi:c-type cytochrome [Natribacillus halophilus]|uniref:Cytochrome c550 n=1 Tax=Natribacillus halophilus TaxID=549003 RepID=A0A1G8JRQ9_9BACI|nr:cytochrome c [Natribacillus halophilus]SDI33763.1 cytochrome c550 [Natribacillus halophilus]
MKGQPLIPFLLIAVAGIFLMLILSFVGLGDFGEEAEENGNGEENGEENGEDAVEVGEEVYEQDCLSCHGENMEGDTGPAIEGQDPDAVITAIEEGPGSMPEGLVDGEDAEAVAEYVSEGGGD